MPGQRSTAPFAHGLVVGRFYPPHRGHTFLVERAARQCGRLIILVMAARLESVSLTDRVAWLAATTAHLAHVSVIGVACDAPVEDDRHVWVAQEAVIRAALRHAGASEVDVVFTGGACGDELADRLRATHVAVDPFPTVVPISAMAMRADLAGHWGELVPAARRGLSTRVVVVGAESTGTTTVARRLAEHFRARGGVWARTGCVDEYGREYTADKLELTRAAANATDRPLPDVNDLSWDEHDFDLIAAEQTRREERAATEGSPLLICDTDAFATAVWERRYLSGSARPLPSWATTLLPRRDLYLLTSHHGVAWIADGLREGELAIRVAMTDWFADALTAAGHSWLLLTGDVEERVALALRAIDSLLASRLAPARPS